MLFYFLRGGHIAGVDILSAGISDEEAIAQAQALAANRKKRKGPLDGLEVFGPCVQPPRGDRSSPR